MGEGEEIHKTCILYYKSEQNETLRKMLDVDHGGLGDKEGVCVYRKPPYFLFHFAVNLRLL